MTKRIEFIDALRGFTMILVVMWHVYGFAYSNFEYQLNSYNQIFVLFRMPLFFFISGFILYGGYRKWRSTNDCFNFVQKKSKIQLIPTAIFGLAFIFFFNYGLDDAIYDVSKKGYWFTIVLFIYFCIFAIYYIVVEKLCHIPDKIANVILMAIGLACYLFARIYCRRFLSEEIIGLLSIPNLEYFAYFVFGFLLRKYYSTCERILDSKAFSTITLLAFFSLTALHLKGYELNKYVAGGKLDIFIPLVIALLGIITLFSFFRRYESSLSQQCKVGYTLQYIGRRTLDVYLLHYFFVPHNLPMVGEFFKQYDNPILEFSLTFAIALIVIGCCLVVSSFIRVSPFLAHYLFGAKYNS